jgi:two-component system phosphate regulon response regulator PhoB
MAPRRVLIVAPPSEKLELLIGRLRDASLWVEWATTGDEGLRRAAELLPEVVLISVRLPDTTPIELTLQLRSVVSTSPPPVLLLTAPGELSVDDPFASEGERKSYLPVMTRLVDQIIGFFHQTREPTVVDCLTYCGLRLDRGRHRAWIDEEPLSLTPTEFRLLWELVRRPGYVLSRSELTRTCKGSENAVQARTIDAHIKSIRRKLRDRAHLIETVHGVGYRFQEMEVSGKSLATREP